MKFKILTEFPRIAKDILDDLGVNLVTILSTLALVLGASPALSQTSYPVGSYTPQTINLPISSLAAAQGTNFANGWNTIVSVTNTSTTWNSSSNAFISVTNVVSATNKTYASFYCGGQKDVSLEFDGVPATGTTFTNVTIALQPGVSANNPATVAGDQILWTIPGTATNSAGHVVACTNLPATWGGALGYVFVVAMTNLDTVSYQTNFTLKAGRKIGAN